MPDPSLSGGPLTTAFTPNPSGAPVVPPLTAAGGLPQIDFATLVRQYGPDQAAAIAPSLGIKIDPAYTNLLVQQSKDIIGAGGPLSQQIQTLQTNEQKAAQAKMDRIDQAMQVLKGIQSGQTTNLPLLAAGAAMLAPTRTGAFTESLSNGLSASIPQIEQQRQRQLEQARLQGNLGIESADVQGELAKQQTQDFYKLLDLSQSDLKYAAATGARLEANANTNNTRILTTGMNDQTRLQTNQNTVDAKDRQTEATAAYRAALTANNANKQSETVRHDQAMEAVRQQLGGDNIAQKDWNDYQARVTANMNAISNNSKNSMQVQNMSADELRAKAIEMTPPPPIAGKNPTPKAPLAPAQKPQPSAGAGQQQRPPLDDIFNPAPSP
jgi:hypothetical protein